MATPHPMPHGSARFATEADLLQRFYPWSDHRPNGAVVIGDHLEFDGEGHLLTIAPARSGKGTRLLVPSLLRNTTYAHRLMRRFPEQIDNGETACSLYSSVVVDPKGENAFMMPGTPAVPYLIFNPWGVLGLPSIPINPLDVLDEESPFIESDARRLAAMLIPNEAGEKPFFNDRARDLVTLVMLHLVLQKPAALRSIPEIYRHLCFRTDNFRDMLEEATEHPLLESPANDMLGSMEGGSDSWHDILATAKRQLAIFNEEALRRALRPAPDHVRDYYRNLATSWMARRVYIVIPVDLLASHRNLIRLMVGALMLMTIRRPGRRVVFYLDEFRRLGPLEIIEEAFSTFSGLGIICWPFLQDLAQLRATYPDTWESFLANARIAHYFGVNDPHTARALSDLVGQQTVLTRNQSEGQGSSESESFNRSRSRSTSQSRGESQSTGHSSGTSGDYAAGFWGGKERTTNWNYGTSDSSTKSSGHSESQSTSDSEGRSSSQSRHEGHAESETGRPLLYPDEIRRLPEGEVLMFASGMAPAWLRLPAYHERQSRFSARAFAQHLKPNPYVFPDHRPENRLETSQRATKQALEQLQTDPADVMCLVARHIRQIKS